MKNQKILFVSLAANQAVFFLKIGNALKSQGFEVGHVCFHEGSQKDLSARGEIAYNPYCEVQEDWESLDFGRFGIESPMLLLGHENAAYELRNTQSLVKKFKRNLSAMTCILNRFGRGRPVTIIQELGGFTSVLAAYYAARHLGHDNYFIEPSFFRGRMFLTKNSLQAPVVGDEDMAPANPETKRLLNEIVEAQAVAIPIKDRLHYRSAFHKLTDARSVRRLFAKVLSKYVKGEKEEFDHIWGHVLRHLRMQWNTLRLRGSYQHSIEPGFIYYPLHVPADFALTIRSSECLDQFALIDFLCRITPLGRQVVIKEHPAQVGSASARRMKDLLQRHDNLKLLHPSFNNHEVIRLAAAVVTVNSKAGAEALLHGKSVLVLGDAFYRTSSLVTRVPQLAHLEASIRSLLAESAEKDEAEIQQYFQGVWNRSYAGELYYLSDQNIVSFTKSILKIIPEK